MRASPARIRSMTRRWFTATITQHDLHQVRCGCGRRHVAARPENVQGSPAGYGPHLRALVVYLMIFQHIPVHRCARLVADLIGARPSAGFIHGMLTRAADAVKDVVALIRTLITAAYVVGFDETVVRVGKAGTKKYVLSASTSTCTVFGLGGRDLDSFKTFAVLPAFTGIAVHDRYVNYDHDDLAKQLAGHQLCTAHLLRDIASAAHSHPEHRWPEQATRALRGLLHAPNTARDRLTIRSYISTAAKQGVDIMNALLDAITGNPLDARRSHHLNVYGSACQFDRPSVPALRPVHNTHSVEMIKFGGISGRAFRPRRMDLSPRRHRAEPGSGRLRPATTRL
jgi:transposase IS66 family protein